MHKYTTQKMIATRQAVLPDVGQICGIIQPYAEQGALLPRGVAELCENIRDFIVAGQDGLVLGCGALHLYGMHLAEIRSVAVLPEQKGRGAGRLLVEALIEESKRHGVTCLCLFTRTPGFFSRLGFEISSRQDLPDKIYKDCIHCPKLTCCDEIAMVMGQLPPKTNGLREPGILVPILQNRHDRT